MDEKLLELAREEGFYAAVIPAADVPVDPKFGNFVRRISAVSMVPITPALRTAAVWKRCTRQFSIRKKHW